MCIRDRYSWASKLSSPTDYEVKDFFQTGYNVANTVSLTTGTQKNQTYANLINVPDINLRSNLYTTEDFLDSLQVSKNYMADQNLYP